MAKQKLSSIEFHAKRGDMRAAFRLAAEKVRVHVPAPEGETIAQWFDRLAEGERPNSVFRAPAGRPRNEDFDKHDIANAVQTLVENGAKAAEALDEIARYAGLSARTVGNYWREKYPRRKTRVTQK